MLPWALTALKAVLPAVFITLGTAAIPHDQRAKYDTEENREKDPEQPKSDDGEDIAHNKG